MWADEVRLIRDEQGDPLRLLALIEDISERRRLDEEQQRLTEQVRTILECITDGFVALDPDWRYTYVNKRAGELLGREPEDLIGKNSGKSSRPASTSPSIRRIRRRWRRRGDIFFEDYYEPWDRWFENRVYGSRTGVAIYFTEVTERKRSRWPSAGSVTCRGARRANDTLTRTLDLEVLGVLLDSMTAFVPYTSAAVLSLTEDGQLAVGASRGYEHVDDAEMTRGFRTCGSIRACDRCSTKGERSSSKTSSAIVETSSARAPEHVRSWIGVPLRAGGQVIGLCSIENSGGGRVHQEDADWAEAMTAQASRAIENARLHDQLRRHAAD